MYLKMPKQSQKGNAERFLDENNFCATFVTWRLSAVFSYNSGEVGHAPNCIMVEVINQSGACIFLQVDLEGIVARGMKRFSLRVFSV